MMAFRKFGEGRVLPAQIEQDHIDQLRAAAERQKKITDEQEQEEEPCHCGGTCSDH